MDPILRVQRRLASSLPALRQRSTIPDVGRRRPSVRDRRDAERLRRCSRGFHGRPAISGVGMGGFHGQRCYDST